MIWAFLTILAWFAVLTFICLLCGAAKHQDEQHSRAIEEHLQRIREGQ